MGESKPSRRPAFVIVFVACSRPLEGRFHAPSPLTPLTPYPPHTLTHSHTHIYTHNSPTYIHTQLTHTHTQTSPTPYGHACPPLRPHLPFCRYAQLVHYSHTPPSGPLPHPNTPPPGPHPHPPTPPPGPLPHPPPRVSPLPAQFGRPMLGVQKADLDHQVRPAPDQIPPVCSPRTATRRGHRAFLLFAHFLMCVCVCLSVCVGCFVATRAAGPGVSGGQGRVWRGRRSRVRGRGRGQGWVRRRGEGLGQVAERVGISHGHT